jgi:hypothetical protein
MGLLVAAVASRREHPNPVLPPETRALRIAFLLLSLLLLLKILFAARIFHYGFVLAVPASMVIAIALLGWIPSAIRSRGGQGALFRSWGAGLLLAFTAINLVVIVNRLREETYALGSGPDRIRTDEARGRVVDRAMAIVEGRLGPDGTLVAIPEGVSINYLARRRNPTPYVSFLPPEVIHFGEAKMLRALDESLPDMVLHLHTQTESMGTGRFGVGYGQLLVAWMSDNYVVVERIVGATHGDEPPFRIDVLVRADLPGPVGEARSEVHGEGLRIIPAGGAPQ